MDLSNLSNDELIALRSKAQGASFVTASKPLSEMSNSELQAMRSALVSKPSDGTNSTNRPMQESLESPQYDTMGNPTGATETVSQAPVMSYGDQMRHVGGALDSTARMMANGATFGLADKFAGGMNAVTGNAPSYDAGVRAERAKTDEIRKAQPVAAAAAEMAGGVASGGALIKSSLTLAGRMGSGLLPRIVGYGLEGAAYGAAQGAGNTYSDEVSDYLKNAGKGAEYGALVGAALPVIGTTVGGAYRLGSAYLGPRVQDAGRGASGLLRRAAMADEQGLRNLPQLGPEAMLPDAGPAMLGLAQGAGTGTGAGRTALARALQSRDAGTPQRLAQSLEKNFGTAPTPSRIEAGLSADRAYAGQGYAPVLEKARAVDTQNLANHLETEFVNSRGASQRAVRQVRGMLDIPGNPGNLDPHPQGLLATRQAVDGLMATETNPDVIRRLTNARQAVDDQLARAAPGIKAVDAQIGELSRQSAGLERGGQILDTGKTAIRPAELAAEMQQGANPQGQLVGPSATPFRMKQGVRADIDRRVGTNINDLNELEKTFATSRDWNYQKLGKVFGEAPRDAVAADITANRTFRDTYQKVVQGSQTAQRTAAANSMDAASGKVPSDITATSIGLKAVNGLAKILTGQSNAATKDEVGRLLAKRGPEAYALARELMDAAQTTNSRARALATVLSSPKLISASAPEYGRR